MTSKQAMAAQAVGIIGFLTEEDDRGVLLIEVATLMGLEWNQLTTLFVQMRHQGILQSATVGQSSRWFVLEEKPLEVRAPPAPKPINLAAVEKRRMRNVQYEDYEQAVRDGRL